MPTLEEALRSYIGNYSPALSFGTRVYARKAPPDPETPYLVFFEIDIDPLHTHLGPPTVRRRTYQFSSYSELPSAATRGGDEVTALLDGFRGLMAGLDIRGIQLKAGRLSPMETETKLFHESRDMFIQYLPS